MHSDGWLRAGYTSDARTRLHDAVDYRIWRDQDGTPVGIGIDFEFADDVHVELTRSAWEAFRAVIGVGEGEPFEEALRGVTGHWIELLQVLKAHEIPYTDIHFY